VSIEIGSGDLVLELDPPGIGVFSDPDRVVVKS
jgi:hypothetical protein